MLHHIELITPGQRYRVARKTPPSSDVPSVCGVVDLGVRIDQDAVLDDRSLGVPWRATSRGRASIWLRLEASWAQLRNNEAPEGWVLDQDHPCARSFACLSIRRR